jgi:hypothetical protein
VRRQCSWFGCSAVATATYTFDSEACTVWLDMPFAGGARAGELCTRHAHSLTPPRGWRLEDRRPEPSVAAPPDEEPAAEPVAAETVVSRAALDSEAELQVLLDAHTPLLARAFRSSGTV